MARTLKKAAARKVVARKAIAKGMTATEAAVRMVIPDSKVVKARAADATKAIKKLVQDLKGSRTAKVAAAAVTLAAVGLLLRNARRR
jgi:hypothetical protein